MHKPLKTKGKAASKVARIDAKGLSVSAIAAELGFSRESVRRKLHASGVDTAKGAIRWRDVVKAFGAAGDWRAERARLTSAQADREEHDLALARRDVMPRAEVADWIRKTFSPVRELAVAMPAVMASRVNPTDPRHAQVALEEWTEGFLRHVRERCGEEDEGK